MDRLMRLLVATPGIYLLAIGLRLLWALLVPVMPVSDSAAYDTFAVNIWQHGTYGWQPDEPGSYWAVGTSAIYAALYLLFGHAYWPIVALNICLSVGILFFTGRLCQIFFSDPRVARLSLLLLALWPTGIFYVTVLASELLFMFFSVAGLYCFVTADKGAKGRVVFAGLLLGAAYYVRPLITVSIIIFAIACFAYLRQRPLAVVLRTGCCFLILALMVAPWAYRNYQLYDDFVPMSSNGGAVFWMGNSPGTNGGYAEIPPDVIANTNSTYEMSRVLRARALEYIAEEPVAFVQRTFIKLFRFHSYETIGITWNAEGIRTRFGEGALLPLKILAQGYWLLLLAAGLGGLALTLYQAGLARALTHPFILSWGANAGIHALIASQDRYHLPTVPFIAAFAALALVAVSDRLLRGHTDSTAYPRRASQAG
ncbi:MULTISPECIES: hypothetical protein [Microbulbifer]|uniref:hypothetical protein n=1 Tax=Microbulbifer TaxID=48073 RepID=UPI001E35D5D8|nr:MULTISPECIES: hypothetical protein [Microbulbifer]UHQ54055.1 hypothetical protein LVE68_11060 [Microbulbifer sp. YPW16]